MDKNAIKKYAVWARRELIARVSQRAALYEITDKGFGDASSDSVLGRVMSADEKKQRQALIRKIKEKGFEQVMEEIAYTWFNRFIALRFMEVNNYLPSHVRVFTDEENNFKPQILTEAINMELDGLNMERVYALKDANANEALFKYLLIVQCNALSGILPGMFQRIADYTELLFPDNLLREGSVIEQMITMIPQEDWTDQVQIIGWLYQYYNTEPKDKVFADLKKSIKISKENIPAATQLFTPDWIVRYMVENSLGRLWIEGHPNDELKKKWKYYLEEAEQIPEVQAQLTEIRKDYAALTPEEIRVIDPCCGSGHILCYLFDVLVQIYEDYGYTARDAAQRIVQLNLHGLDIDPRAAQLSYFSVMMKARQYDRRFFSRNIQPMVYSPDGYPEGMEYGSLITVDDLEPAPNFDNWTLHDGDYLTALNRWSFRYVLNQKYHIVVTNPPYMNPLNGGTKLSSFAKEYYPDSKSDLFAMFIERIHAMLKPDCFQAMITQHSWMFLGSYERLRRKMQHFNLINLAHLGPRAFEEIGGEVVQTAAFVFRKKELPSYNSTFVRLLSPNTQKGKEELFLSGEEQYISEQCYFIDIPGIPMAYWLPRKTIDILTKDKLSDKFEARNGITTGQNDLFIRHWYEVGDWKDKWFPCNKGGSYRKWYGNLDFVIDWENDGYRLRHFYNEDGKLRSTLRSIDKRFEPAITMSRIGGGLNSFRILPRGFITEGASNNIYFNDENSACRLLALLNTNVCQYILDLYNPTINIMPDDLNGLPITGCDTDQSIELVEECINLCKVDWNSFETSWEFQRHPLVTPAIEHGYMRLSESWEEWKQACSERFELLKNNEQKLNRCFIDLYSLQDVLSSEVPDTNVTVRRSDLCRDIRSLISYSVGCMFGRYSLDDLGLAYAGGVWNNSKYSTFLPDKDAIIPICDDEYFRDDIVGRFVEFVETVYGKETLEDNLKFIANALGGKGSPRDVIRSYFLNDFYSDHLRIYQKRPIYWLFDSGKRNGFKCLIYMHRYQPDTIARIRTDYVHEQQSRYRTAISDLEARITAASTAERVKLSKQLSKLRDQAEELRVYEEKIHHLADQMIPIDLDDGVKVNYAKFQDVLAKIK